MSEIIEFEDGCKIITRYNDYSLQEANKAHEKILSELYKLFSKNNSGIKFMIKNSNEPLNKV